MKNRHGSGRKQLWPIPEFICCDEFIEFIKSAVGLKDTENTVACQVVEFVDIYECSTY
jgi:hypothetical protein